MMRPLRRRRDVWAGLLLLVLGLATVGESRSLDIGTLTRMGPGYFPTVLGAVLALLGLAIALSAAPAGRAPLPGAEPAPHEEVPPPDWRGIGAIVLGIVAFLVLGRYAGLVPATFACVLLSAGGDRLMTPGAALVLAAAMTAVAVGLFHYALQVPFPLFGR